MLGHLRRWRRDAACRVSTALSDGFRLWLAALREIFDEAGFLRERAAAHERRPRCC
jgi:hypothetical protein